MEIAPPKRTVRTTTLLTAGRGGGRRALNFWFCASGMWRGGMRRYGRLIYGTCGSCRKMRERSNNKQASKNTQKRKEKADGSQATENSGH